MFDTSTQKQRRPLYDAQLAGKEVTCMEISEDGHWLMAGYTDGVLALWDCSRFRLAYLMTDVLKD